MIPLYTLGLLLRFGPQHGYNIKKLISEQLVDFTQIKLPAVYYHLEKMAQAGFISASKMKPNARPEKTVYEITELGKLEFRSLLVKTLEFDYRPTFNSDAVFFFSDSLEPAMVAEKLQAYISKIDHTLAHLTEHQNETLMYLPAEFRDTASILFNHHIKHFEAEFSWAKQSYEILCQEDKADAKTKSYRNQ